MQNHETNFVSLTHNIFRFTLFDWQRHVGTKLLDDNPKQNEIRLLCVQPTEGGKIILYQIVADQLKVFCIYISPLLSLSSDQVNTLIMKTRSDGTKNVVNLD